MLVPVADGEKRLRFDDTHDLVYFCCKLFGRCRGRRRDCDDDTSGLLLSQHRNSGVHCRTGRNPIIHKNDGAPMYVKGWTIPTVEMLAPLQFLLLACSDGFDYFVRNP